MAKIKLTKTVVESAKPQAQAVELRDTVVPGFLRKITPTGRRVFMLSLIQRGMSLNQAKRALRKYNDIHQQPFPLFLKECEFRFNYGTPKQPPKILRDGC